MWSCLRRDVSSLPQFSDANVIDRTSLASILVRFAVPAISSRRRMELMAPLLEVDGVGPVALPLLRYGRALARVAQPHPMDVVTKRLSIERAPLLAIGPETGGISGVVAEMLGRSWAVSRGLGVTDTVRAGVLQALVYDQGSFFVSHRDTENRLAVRDAVTGAAVASPRELLSGTRSRSRVDLRRTTARWFAAFTRLHPRVCSARCTGEGSPLTPRFL